MFEKIQMIQNELKSAGIRVKVDLDDTKRPGFKFAEYELQGVPVRLVLGARDLQESKIEIARRDTKEKWQIPMDETLTQVQELLLEYNRIC